MIPWEDMAQILSALERIAAAQEIVAAAVKAEEARSNERMEIMRKIGQSIEAGEAQMLIDAGMVTKQ